MSNRQTFSAEEIIDIAAHYEAKEEPWIHMIKDISAIRLYGPSPAMMTASVPIRCKTLTYLDDGTVCEGDSRPLQLKFSKQLIRCSVRAQETAVNENAVKYVSMSFHKLDAGEIAHLPHNPVVQADLIERNNTFIEALALIAAEMNRLQDSIYANPDEPITNGKDQRFPPEGGKKFSFCQATRRPNSKRNETRRSYPLEKPIYRFRLPVVRESGRVATQYGRRAKVNPVIFVAVRNADNSQSKKELKVPIFARASDEHPLRYDSITYGNVSKMMTRHSAVWSTANFKDLCIFGGGISVIVECSKLVVIPQEKIVADDDEDLDEVLASGLATSSLEQVARSTREETEADDDNSGDELPTVARPAPTAPVGREEAVLAAMTPEKRAQAEAAMAMAERSDNTEFEEVAGALDHRELPTVVPTSQRGA